MKRTILISIMIAVLMLASSIFAQDAARPMKYGIKAGFGMANLTGDIDGNKSMLTPGFGLFLTYKASPNFAIQPEVLYEMKGTKEDGGDGKIKLNYITVPVLLKYVIPTQGKMAPSIFAGPYLGFKASAKDQDGTKLEGVKSTDFGVAFGAGLDFAAGATGVFTIDARYELGLSNTNDVGDVSVKNSWLGLYLGYGF
jgi:hypothetical protein